MLTGHDLLRHRAKPTAPLRIRLAQGLAVAISRNRAVKGEVGL
jgi:hypothetical protein